MSRGWGITERSRRTGNCHQDIFWGGGNLFSIKKGEGHGEGEGEGEEEGEG